MAPERSEAFDWRDAAAGVLLLLFVAWYVWAELDLRGRPEEDAAMLMRYSRHLAAGHGIVWNIGEKPVDGATDFLFLVVLAAVHGLGPSLETAARAIGLVAHAATVWLVFWSARRQFGASREWALVPAVFIGVGPGLRHLAAGYGTPLFALTAAVAWIFACALARADAGKEARPALAFALAALVMGLARPEGVFLGGFMLLAVLGYRGGQGTTAILGRFLLVFLTLGLFYFLWRWHYFGYPLPNPFYKKGGGLLYWHSLRQSWKNLWALGWPFLWLVPLGLAVRRTHRAAFLVALPVVLFVTLFVLISDETNYVMRFRYPILPVLLLGCVPVAQALAAGRRWRFPASKLAPLGLAAALAVAQHQSYRFVAPQRLGLYDAGLVLRDYAARGFALATTEAGLLPLVSEWRAVDAWGLNDQYIAHHGGIDEAYLDRYRPELIVFHAYFSPKVPDHGERVENRSLGRPWYRMVMTLKAYAEKNGYELAACFGRNEWDTHYYYVRRGFPQGREITERLRAIDYYWDGEPTVDLAAPHEAAAGAP